MLYMLLSCVLPLSKLFTIIFKPRGIHCFIQGNDYIFYYKVLIKVNHASHQANAAFPTQRLYFSGSFYFSMSLSVWDNNAILNWYSFTYIKKKCMDIIKFYWAVCNTWVHSHSLLLIERPLDAEITNYTFNIQNRIFSC